MARRKLQFSLLTLFVFTSLASVTCVAIRPIMRHRDLILVNDFPTLESIVSNALIFSPFFVIIFWCFKDVFKDFGIGGRRHDAHVARQLPEKLELPESPPDEEPRRPRKRRKIRTASWWHPLGGWSKR